ncbi:DinB family protein [Pseudonocardia zijingensis]|uniref:DinB family protein n=1 Tax=Pseudonocardia zijingensis TaxID=153376 RepID=A0ABN1NAP9_9PSEU
MDDEKKALLGFLAAQRAVVLAILDGLDGAALTSEAGSLGWTPLGMVEHLGYAERHWFQTVLTGSADPLEWPDDDHTPLNTPRPPSTVFAFYAAQCERSDEILAATPLSAHSLGHHPGPNADEFSDARRIVLHMIEETARHAGHLDIARQMIDGTTGRGFR